MLIDYYTIVVKGQILKLTYTDPIVEDSDENLNQMDHNNSEASGIVALIVAFLLKFQIFYRTSDNAIVTL